MVFAEKNEGRSFLANRDSIKAPSRLEHYCFISLLIDIYLMVQCRLSKTELQPKVCAFDKGERWTLDENADQSCKDWFKREREDSLSDVFIAPGFVLTVLVFSNPEVVSSFLEGTRST
ncbi:hypothetical protein CEXT_276961 [Caerostris extrusa]|uniref:Uncharacterized protein n=1 Tax=Caerostris extrusa TaxID=172846 RepID=A0AAV4QUL5_CAEEX|nr:hypothetical protein CEXT_276961 [Caerostris extrusa]